MADADESDEARRSRGLPPEPQLSGQQREPVDPPKPVKASFLVWIASALAMIAGYVYTLTAKQEITDRALELKEDPDIPDEQIAEGVTSLLWTLIVGATVFGVLFVLFAYKAREGTRSARTVLTVLVAVTVLFQLVFSNPGTIVATFGAVVALSLMYLPSVAHYFPKVGKSL